tara:strand:+ start:273 stop:557 length:285 start_codon:yes stop_codon:yes gene_type:complete
MNVEIIKARKKLDKVDVVLLSILKKRILLVKRIVKFKKNKKEIVDKKRINYILKKIKQKSIILKIDPFITVNIWKEMINTFIKYEFKSFKKRKR